MNLTQLIDMIKAPPHIKTDSKWIREHNIPNTIRDVSWADGNRYGAAGSRP